MAAIAGPTQEGAGQLTPIPRSVPARCFEEVNEADEGCPKAASESQQYASAGTPSPSKG